MLSGAVLLMSAVASAPAANINTNATECQAQSWPQDAIIHTEKGIATASDVISPVWISCSVLRSPLVSGATSGGFWVDGDNRNGATTVCSLASYDYTGQFLGASSFSTPGTSYDIFLSLPVAQLGFWAYTGITCVLPGHGDSTLRGITSVQ